MMPLGIAIWFALSVIAQMFIPWLFQKGLRQRAITILRTVLAINTIMAFVAFDIFANTLDKSMHRVVQIPLHI